MREALSLVQEGIATPEDIDDAVRYSFGFRYAAVGPMTQKEISGWDGMANAAGRFTLLFLIPHSCPLRWSN
jgi:3-hydroxybutyryl-CoA dehydrogenase